MNETASEGTGSAGTGTQDTGSAGRLRLQEISDLITGYGWRLVLGVARTTVRTSSLAQAAAVTERIAAAGLGGDGSLSADVRAGLVILTLGVEASSPGGGR